MAKTVIDFLKNTVKKFPDKTAVADENREMTFRQLDQESQCVAQGLLEAGLVRRPAAVFMDKSAECICAMLGIARSGNFYTILDTEMPVSRIQKICNTLKPAVFLTCGQYQEQVQAFASDARIYLYEDLQKKKPEKEKIKAAEREILPVDILYVLFTSGSTGNPKGVVTPHRAVVDYIDAAAESFGLDENTVMASQVPFYFVMSIVDIYETIRNGSTLYIPPKMDFAFPALLVKYIAQHRINTLYWVPSALVMIANLNAFDVADISCLKKVMFGGEVMPVKQLNKWRAHLPDAEYINSYGPTEVTDGISYYRVEREFKDSENLPIGVAHRNCQLFVLDEHDRLVTDGEVGELCVRSSSMTFGYYGEPEKSAEVFVSNPLNSCYEEMIYRTGDLVVKNEYGELVFAGRKDGQIKHMGHRIELGEIEAAAASVDGILENCCLYDEKRQQIVLFYTGTADKKEVKEQMRLLVPEYMVPGKRIRLEEMPRNLNGKTDRAALRQRL